MLIPYSAPKVPELDSLSPTDRADVMRIYASSREAMSLIKKLKVSPFISLIFLGTPVLSHRPIGLIFGFIGILFLVLSFGSYRSSARKVILGILADKQRDTNTA